MPFSRTYLNLSRSIVVILFWVSANMCAPFAHAQTKTESQIIDPRLVEIVQSIKRRALDQKTSIPLETKNLPRDKIYLNLLSEIQTAYFSQDVNKIIEANEAFKDAYAGDAPIALERIYDLYASYTQLRVSNASLSKFQSSIDEFSIQGSWFERYVALSLSLIHI